MSQFNYSVRCIIHNTIIKMLHNGPDDPSPKIEPILKEVCNKPSTTHDEYFTALAWFETNNLFTYKDLFEWLDGVIWREVI